MGALRLNEGDSVQIEPFIFFRIEIKLAKKLNRKDFSCQNMFLTSQSIRLIGMSCV